MSAEFVASCTIISGTNGSGKSTIYDEAVRLQIQGEFVNADLLARNISPNAPETASFKAGKQVVSLLESDGKRFIHVVGELSANERTKMVRYMERRKR